MSWVAISMHGKTDLYIVQNGALTATRYVNEILDVDVRPYTGLTNKVRNKERNE